MIDCATRKIAGWAMDDNYKTPLISRPRRAAHSLATPKPALQADYSEFGQPDRVGGDRGDPRYQAAHDNTRVRQQEQIPGVTPLERAFRTLQPGKEATSAARPQWLINARPVKGPEPCARVSGQPAESCGHRLVSRSPQ